MCLHPCRGEWKELNLEMVSGPEWGMKVMANCGDGQKKPYSGNVHFLEGIFDMALMGCS